MKARSGFILPAVLMLAGVLIMFAAIRHFFSRNQLTQASHDAHYEKAFHLAIGGIESSDKLFQKAVAFFNDSRIETIPKIEKAPPELAAILKALLNEDGLPYARKDLVPVHPSVLKHLQSAWEKFSSLKVEIELREIENLVSVKPLAGPVAEPLEKRILVLLHAEASVNGAVARVCRYREAKLVNILPSALGKFVLFLRQQGSLSNNSFEDSLGNVSLLKDTPLMIFAGKTSEPASLNPEAAAEFMEQQGWVFLGGDAPWIIGSGPGGGNPDYASGLQKNEMQTYAIQPPDEFSSLNYLSYYSQPEFLSGDLKSSAYKEVLQLSSDELFSSRIRISGNKSKPTPTNVVGKVVCKWALLQGIINTIKNEFYPFPFLNESNFKSSNWPGLSANSAMTMEENFGGLFQRYKSRMSSVVEERYNAINLRVLKFPAPPLNSAIQIDPRNVPPGTKLPAPSKRMNVDASPASFFDANYGNSYQVFCNDGKKLFDGNLSEFADLSYFTSKAVEKFERQKDFFKSIETENKELVINNTFHIKGDLTIDRPLKSTAGCGGIIMVDGDIVIRNEIIAPDREPIVLISIGGNIRIATPGSIQAGLVALKGQIQADSSLSIDGIVSGRELSMARLTPLGSRKITYNQNFDVTDAQTYKRGFRLLMPKDGVTFVK